MVVKGYFKASPRARLARRSSLLSYAVYGKPLARSAGVAQLYFKTFHDLRRAAPQLHQLEAPVQFEEGTQFKAPPGPYHAGASWAWYGPGCTGPSEILAEGSRVGLGTPYALKGALLNFPDHIWGILGG